MPVGVREDVLGVGAAGQVVHLPERVAAAKKLLEYEFWLAVELVAALEPLLARDAALEQVLPVPVIKGPFLGITEHLVGLADQAELLDGGGLVPLRQPGVVLQGQPPVGLRDFPVAG